MWNFSTSRPALLLLGLTALAIKLLIPLGMRPRAPIYRSKWKTLSNAAWILLSECGAKATTLATTGGPSNQLSLPSWSQTENPGDAHALLELSIARDKRFRDTTLQTTFFS